MTASTKSPAATKSAAPALPPVTDSLPTKQGLAPEVVANVESHGLRFIVTNDKSMVVEEGKVRDLTVASLAFGSNAQKSSDDLARELGRFRRMFKAPVAVRTLLGQDDAPDLGGMSTEYRAALGRINKDAAEAAIDQLVEEGWSVRQAKNEVEQEQERTRNRVSRAYRVSIERTAAKMGKDAGRLFLLAYGYNYHQACGSEQLLKAGDRLVLDPKVKAADPKAVLTVGNAVILGKAPATTPGTPPAEQSDQATPAELAENVARQHAAELEAAGVGNPKERINLAVGEMATAIADKRMPKIAPAERLAMARLVAQRSFETLLAIGETFPVGSPERREIATMAKQVSGVIVATLLPEVAKEAATK